MKQITFAKVKELVEAEIGCPVNPCLLWGKMPIKISYPENRKAYFRKFRHIAQRRDKFEHNINDCGNNITVNDLYKVIQQLQVLGRIELGSYEVIP